MEITERRLLEAITFGIGELLFIPDRVWMSSIFGYVPYQEAEFRVCVYLDNMEFSIGVRRGGRLESMGFDIADPDSFKKAARAILEWDIRY